MKRLLNITLLSIYAVCMMAAVEFKASAPQTVVLGQPFKLVYIVNESGSDLRLPDLKDFEVVAGPYTSTTSSTNIINGKMTHTKEVRYTYNLIASKEGTFTIPSASIKVDNTRYNSNALQIKVLPEDKTQQAPSTSQNSNATSQSITADNLFIRAITSRTTVHEQEAIVLTYRVYSRVDLINIQNVKMPEFNNCLVQDIELPQNRQLQQEHYNGANYLTFDISKQVLFPQKTGKITIEPLTADLIVRIRQRSQGGGFFGGFFDTYQDVARSTASPRVTITSTPLPTPKPTDFTGFVGELNVATSITSTSVKANEAITLTVKFSGHGNLKILKEPSFVLPSDFETYEPKTTNKFTASDAGLAGTKTIEYLFIPRHDGNFTIPEQTISYFDVASGEYKRLTLQAFDIHVEKGAASDNSTQVVSNFAEQERVKQLASDIMYISNAPLKLRPRSDAFTGSLPFQLAYIIPLLISILLIIIFRKQARDNANVALMRNKKANKVARTRLKTAQKHLDDARPNEFYDEILRALWGYLADKLSIPIADLNKDNIEYELASHSVEQTLIAEFMKLLRTCEFERFAPQSQSSAHPSDIYSQTVDIISSLESQIKRKQ